MRWVITGASRGIGLELARQLLARGDIVEAAARNPASATKLAELRAQHGDRLRAHVCDVVSDASVRAFAAGIAGGSIDVVVNNAGVMGHLGPLEDIDFDDALRTINTNAVGALRVSAAMARRLDRGGKLVQITSGMGSIADNTSGDAYGYRMSKAALNMATRSLSIDLRGRGVTCVVINPGWVQTDMGGAGASVPVEVSAANLIRVVDGLRLEDSGGFLDHTGKTWPW